MIQFLQVLTLTAIVLVIAAYRPKGARFRLGVSALRGLLMGGCAAMACAVATGRLHAHPVILIASLLLLFLVAKERGDVAALIKRIGA